MAKMFNEAKFVEHNFKLIIFDQTSSLFHECLDIGLFVCDMSMTIFV